MSLFFSHSRDLFLFPCEYIHFIIPIRYTSASIRGRLDRHSGFTSLLSLEDIIRQYGVKRTAERKEVNRCDDLRVPCQCSVQLSLPSFPDSSLFMGISDGNVTKEGAVLILEREGKKEKVGCLANRKRGGSTQFSCWVSAFNGCFIFSSLFV